MGLKPDAPVGRTIGLFYGELEDTASLARLDPASKIHRTINDMSGRFTGGVVDLGSDSFAFGTTLVRLDPLYWGEQNGYVVVSTWAGVADACLRSLTGAERSTGRLYSFLNAGFFGDDDTFYGGISAVPAYATVRFLDSRLSIDDEFLDFLCNPTAPDDGLIEQVAAALVDGCQILSDLDPVNLSLSGGKDSRLLLAALRAAGLNVNASTMSGGAHNFTDVYCATLAAQHSGAHHTIKPLARTSVEATIAADDFYRRTKGILLASDCGIISLGNMRHEKRNSGYPILNGLGGELLRGGYSKGLNKVKTVFTPRSLLISKWGRFASLFNAADAADYEAWLDAWLDGAPRTLSLREAADFGYLYCRMGRWGAAQTRTGVLSRRPIYPLLDNKFMTLVYSAPVESRTNDYMLYRTLEKLDPGLAALPLANDYWAFQTSDEVDGLKHVHPNAFLARGAAEAGENLDWRARWIEVLGDVFSRRFFDEVPDSEIFNVVDRSRLRHLFDAGKLNYGHRFPLFAMYAATIVLDENL